MNVSRKLSSFGFARTLFDYSANSFTDRTLGVFVSTFLHNPSAVYSRVDCRLRIETCTRRLTMNNRPDKKPPGKYPARTFAGSGTKAHGTRAAVLEDEVRAEKEKYMSMPIDKKRKGYKCGDDRYLTLNNIVTWPHYQPETDGRKSSVTPKKGSKTAVKSAAQVSYRVRDDLNQKISLLKGDITTLEIDAIVNAANSSLMGGGGVDGAIHGAAGSFLKKECSLLQGCDTGDAKITCGYKLPAKYVIHTVGPMGEKPEALTSAYRRSLDVFQQNQLTSVAFPCISTGIYGYPNEAAAHEALKTIRDWLEKNSYTDQVDRIILCVFMKKDVEIYEDLLHLYFPLPPPPPNAQPTDPPHSAERVAPVPEGKERASKGDKSDPSAGDDKATTVATTEEPMKTAVDLEGQGSEREKEEEMETEGKEEEEDGEKGKGNKRKNKGEGAGSADDHAAVDGKRLTKL